MYIWTIKGLWSRGECRVGDISNNIIIYNLSCFDCFDTYLIQTTQESGKKAELIYSLTDDFTI